MTTTALPPQASIGQDGLLLHEDDLVAQLALSLENLEQTLAERGLRPTELIEVRVLTTDLGRLQDAADVLTDRFADLGIAPRIVLVEVAPRDLDPTGLDQQGLAVAVEGVVGSDLPRPTPPAPVSSASTSPVSISPVSTLSASIEGAPVTVQTDRTAAAPLTDPTSPAPTSPAPISPADALRGLCGGRVHLPGEPDYDRTRVPWSVAVDQRPAAVAVPRSAEEVRELVTAAVAAGLRIAPQSSGHGAGPLAGVDLSDVVLVRLNELVGVTVDPEARIARVEGGTLWQPVIEAAAAHGLTALHGSSPDVAVVGYTLGGGLSWYARELGLAADSLTAVELVLADGRLVRADAEHETDLFWAVRGGGGSFGVVTALEFRLLPIADVYAGMLLWPAERSAEVAHRWAEWTRTVPTTVTTSLRLMSFPPLPELPPFLSGRRLVVIDGALLEDDERAAELLAPLRELDPEMDTMARIPSAAVTRIHMDPEGPTPAVSDHVLIDELPAEAVDALLEAAGPTSGSSLLAAELRHLGGALQGRVNGAYNAFFVAIAPVPPAAEAGLRDGARGVAALAPWGRGRRFLNFADQAVDPETGYGAEVLQRLRAIREVVDPSRRLVANHSL